MYRLRERSGGCDVRGLSGTNSAPFLPAASPRCHFYYRSSAGAQAKGRQGLQGLVPLKLSRALWLNCQMRGYKFTWQKSDSECKSGKVGFAFCLFRWTSDLK